MHDSDSAKRIPKSIGTDAKLFGAYTLTDAAVALLPGVLTVLVIQALLPSSLSIAGYGVQALTVPLAGVAVVVGALLVYLTPAHLTSLDWIETAVRYWRAPAEIAHEDAKQYTQLERVHPERGAIERTDGAFVGMVNVDPPSMALATDEEWQTKTDAFEDFLNTTVEFPIQIYSTTQDFPAEEYLAHYESRLDDPDVKRNPRLATLIEHYIEWYAAELEDRRMTIRDHYVIVTVTPDEVQFDRESLADKLAALPIVGLLVRAWLAPRVETQREAMFDTLDERLQRVETGLREIDGCTARRVAVEDATALLGEFWTGTQFEDGDISSMLRSRPLVGGKE